MLHTFGEQMEELFRFHITYQFYIYIELPRYIGALRSALSAPVGIVLDDYENCITCSTYLNTTVRRSLNDWSEIK